MTDRLFGADSFQWPAGLSLWLPELQLYLVKLSLKLEKPNF
jgi:hypothetical protein